VKPLAVIAALVFLPMIVEAGVSSRHERRLRAAGAVEPHGDVYRAMSIAYPAAFMALIAEGVSRGASVDGWFAAGVALFVLAKTLKYWAIVSLGPRWAFRVLVPPGSHAIANGPYRWLSHPNYIAVAAELAGVALAAHALFAGPVAVAGFGMLMLRRIRIEEAALGRA
jgi:methyltransferase